MLTLVSINIFSLLKYKPKNVESIDEDQQTWPLILSMHVTFMKHFIEYTTMALQNEQISFYNQTKCLPALKIIFDWIFINQSSSFDSDQFKENPT